MPVCPKSTDSCRSWTVRRRLALARWIWSHSLLSAPGLIRPSLLLDLHLLYPASPLIKKQFIDMIDIPVHPQFTPYLHYDLLAMLSFLSSWNGMYLAFLQSRFSGFQPYPPFKLLSYHSTTIAFYNHTTISPVIFLPSYCTSVCVCDSILLCFVFVLRFCVW